jgi:hypothetical protein
MKKTGHFSKDVQKVRPYLLDEYIIDIILNPVKKEIQPDGRIRLWGFVKELDKYVRVVLLPDGETVHTAFPDRNFTKDNKL